MRFRNYNKFVRPTGRITISLFKYISIENHLIKIWYYIKHAVFVRLCILFCTFFHIEYFRDLFMFVIL